MSDNGGTGRSTKSGLLKDKGECSMSKFLKTFALAALLVEHHERLATHTRIALFYTNIATECRFLLLVTNLQCCRFNVDGLIAILRKAL